MKSFGEHMRSGVCQVYLDMDGVLSNFDDIITDLLPHLDHEHINHMWQGLKPKNHYYTDANKEYLQKVKDTPKFWYNLPKLPHADRLVNHVMKTFGVENVGILTAPMKEPNCCGEKMDWVKKHYPQLSKRFICDYKKWDYVGYWNPHLPQLLIDDKHSNIKKWEDHGGVGIQFKNIQDVFEGLTSLRDTLSSR